MAYENFFATRLFVDAGASDTTLTLEEAPASTSGRLVLEARNPTQREIISYTGVSGNDITGVARGQGGTSAHAHIKGSLVEMNVTAEDLEDALSVPEDIETRFNESFEDYVASGLVWTDDIGLTADMSAGVAYVNGIRLSVSAVSNHAFTASKDTYIDLGDNGVLDYNEVANGAASPALAASHIRLAKVVTNGTDTTSVTQTGNDSLGNEYFPKQVIKGLFPQGFLINGKIVTSVATNNLTVAIKTLAGADPSPNDPVYVRIGNTVRAVKAALSVTKNAGTNWFNAGSSELATLEIDYFAYLGYNATDGVVLGFSRIPYARVYSDFSATTTNDKYAAISTITNAAATDEYENIGRFNAILSATASFNWSIPATSIIINRPIFETRELSFTPTWTNLTAGNGTNTGTYSIIGRHLDFRIRFLFGTTSAMGSGPSTKLPMAFATYPGSETSIVTKMCKLVDTGSALWGGFGQLEGTNSLALRQYSAATTPLQLGVQITSTSPHTWANTDEVNVVGDYQI